MDQALWKHWGGFAGEEAGQFAPEGTPLEEANRGPSGLAIKGSNPLGPDLAQGEESVVLRSTIFSRPPAKMVLDEPTSNEKGQALLAGLMGDLVGGGRFCFFAWPFCVGGPQSLKNVLTSCCVDAN
eukprot:3750248-Heterocapsa_arctica.AAC.1